MLLWSIQHVNLFNKLQKDGIVFGDYRRVHLEWRRYYRWMSSQMYVRGISNSDDSKAPVWAWFIYESESKRRPDLRDKGLLPPKTEGVRICLEVPDDHCLLSQFEMWVWVLTGKYIPSDFDEDDHINRLEKERKLTRDMIESSWDRIFDLKFGKLNFWNPHNKREIQATLPFMKMEWVKKVDYFTAR